MGGSRPASGPRKGSTRLTGHGLSCRRCPFTTSAREGAQSMPTAKRSRTGRSAVSRRRRGCFPARNARAVTGSSVYEARASPKSRIKGAPPWRTRLLGGASRRTTAFPSHHSQPSGRDSEGETVGGISVSSSQVLNPGQNRVQAARRGEPAVQCGTPRGPRSNDST
jgi:hypothetical protein